MSDLEKKPEKKEEMMKSTLMFSNHAKVTATVALITVSSIVLFSFGGWKLDQWLGIAPILFILGIIFSFPIAQIVIYQWIKKHHIPNLKKKN